jgi:AcrR family transcriptional regulator
VPPTGTIRRADEPALIAAARSLFAERGYAGVEAEEIVERAGVGHGRLERLRKEELLQAALVQITAETARRIAAAALAAKDPWDAVVAGTDACLDACADPEVRRIVLIDGQSVLGFDVWRAIDAEHGLGAIEEILQRAMDEGHLQPYPADALAQVLLGALQNAATVIASAEDPAAARAEMGRRIRRLLEGLRAARR